MRERAHVRLRAQLPHLAQVEAVRGEQQLGIDLVVAEHFAHEGEAVRVQPARRKSDHDVARLAARAVDQVVSPDDAHARACEVELLRPVDAGQFRRLAADQGAARFAADLGGALDERGDLLLVDLVRCDVVE